MHRFRGKSCDIHHNQDARGSEVIIAAEEKEGVVDTVCIAADDLFEWVGRQMMDRRISTLEQITGIDYLEGLEP